MNQAARFLPISAFIFVLISASTPVIFISAQISDPEIQNYSTGSTDSVILLIFQSNAIIKQPIREIIGNVKKNIYI